MGETGERICRAPGAPPLAPASYPEKTTVSRRSGTQNQRTKTPCRHTLVTIFET